MKKLEKVILEHQVEEYFIDISLVSMQQLQHLVLAIV